MNTVLLVLINTPFWVYFVLAAVIYFAVKSSGERTVSLKRLVFIPVLFFALSVNSIVDLSSLNHLYTEFWLLGLAAGTAGGLLHVRMMSLRINRELKIITLPGSMIGVLVMMVIFGCKYYSGFIKARHYDLAAFNSSVPVIGMLLGLSAGYMVGKMFMFLYRYKTDVRFEFGK